VLPIAAAVAVVQLVAAAVGGGYWFDEVYMLAIGRHHLDWGSADQPPIVPVLAALMDRVAPGSIIALRLPAVVATAAAVVVAALIARELGGDRRAQALTAGAQATALWITLAGHWLTPYTVEPVQWLLLVWLLVRWIRVRDDRLLPVLGLVVGVAAETKFQVLLLCAVLAVAVLALGPRELLGRPMLWLGTGIAVLIALPTLIWQAVHGWPQLQMGAVVASEADALYGGRTGVALALVLVPGIVGVPLTLYGLWRLLRAPELRPYRFLAATFLALFAFFVATAGRPYYLGGLDGLLAAAGAVGLQRRREAGRTRLRWVAWPAYAVATAAAVATLVVSTSITRSDVGEDIARRTAAAYQALPPDQQPRTVVIGQSYILAAYLDGYSTAYGLPQAFSSNRSYGYFPPPPEGADAVLYVGSGPDEVAPHFADVRKVADGGADASVWLCTGRREPWASFWPQLRHLTVS
jgi:4-amino-4-deoxy-L-arabinose transferase-like glycosyltransferase